MSSSNDSRPDNYHVNAKICRLVERYPCMYDRQHSQYLKKDVVDRAWVKIAKEMSDSISSCKERWRNIRTSFARSINVNKIPASANRTKPYYLHEELQFLARHITPGIPVTKRCPTNSYNSPDEESEEIEVAFGEESFHGFAAMTQEEEEEEEDSQQHQSSAEETCEANVTESIPEQQSKPVQQEVEVAEKIMPMCPPKKRQRTMDYDIPEIEIKQDIKSVEMAPADSDFDALFLQGLLPEVKAMDFRQKIMFKRRIYEVIGEIFEDSSAARQSQTLHNGARTTTTAAAEQSFVNAADLAMVRRLNNLLQNTNIIMPSSTTSNSTRRTIGSISSTSRCNARGALTRSGSNLLRVSNNISAVKDEPTTHPED